MEKSLFTFLKNQYKTFLQSAKGLQKRYLEKDLDYMSGLETKYENPSDLLTDKGRDETFYDKMLLDDTISNSLDIFKAIALAVEGTVKAPSDKQEDKGRADWINSMFYRMNPDIWNVFDSALDARVYGFKVAEKIFKAGQEKQFEGKWVIDKLKFMHSVYFDFEYDQHGELNDLIIGRDFGSTQRITGKSNIDNKFAIMVWPYTKDGNYYGISDMDSIYLQYYTKYQIYRWRGIYLQGFGMPVIQAAYESKKMSTAELNALDDQLKNWQEQMYFKIPSTRNNNGDLIKKLELSFLEKKATSTEAYETAIQNLDVAMKRRIFVPDNLGYSSNRKGALAQSKTELEVFNTCVMWALGRLEDFINPHIRQVERLNFGEQDNYCEWEFDNITPKLQADMAKVLIDSKIIDPKEKWLRPYMGIPTITVEEEKELEKKKEERVKNNPLFPGNKEQNKPEEDQDKKGDTEKEMPEKEAEQSLKAKKSKVPFNAEKAEKRFDDLEAEFIQRYNEIREKNLQKMSKKVEQKYTIESYDWIDSIRVSNEYKGALKKTLIQYYYVLMFGGKEDGINEIKDRIDKIKLQDYFEMTPDKIKKLLEEEYIGEYGDLGVLSRDEVKALKELREKAFLAVGEDEMRILKNKTDALRQAVDTKSPIKETIALFESRLREDRKKYALTIARTNASEAYNTGRMSFFNSDKVQTYVEAFQYSAILDDRTTLFCESHNDQVIMKGDPYLTVATPPNHFNCRSVLIPIVLGDVDDPDSYYYNYKEKFDSFGTNIPKNAVNPAKGFGG